PRPHNHDRLLLIGLDAADIQLVERWTADGSLPNLAALRAQGTTSALTPSARYLTGSPWPTFYTGRPPSDHGIYHDFQWRQERMAFAAPSTDWLPGGPVLVCVGASPRPPPPPLPLCVPRRAHDPADGALQRSGVHWLGQPRQAGAAG